jgi:hypothetical protein
MSHIVQIETKLHDPAAIVAACRRLGLAEPVHSTARLYGGEATGLLVQLPGWQFPAVIDPATGVVRYDNFGGHWGDEQHLDRLVQMYCVEKTRIEARKKGHQITEQTLADGSIKLTIRVGGAA